MTTDPRHAASGRDVPAAIVRRELIALKAWASDQHVTHPIGVAWAEQVVMWCDSHLERLDTWEGIFNGR